MIRSIQNIEMKETIRKSKRNNHKRSINFSSHLIEIKLNWSPITFSLPSANFSHLPTWYKYSVLLCTPIIKSRYKIFYFSMFMNEKLLAFFVFVCTCRYEPVICEKYTILILIEQQHENMATQAVKTKSVLLPVFVIRINLILERLKSSGG